MQPSLTLDKSGLQRGHWILTQGYRAWAAQRPAPPSGSPRMLSSWAASLTRAGPGSVTECGTTCESCFSQDFCIQCKRRFYLYKGKCLPTCPLGTAAQQSTRECQGEWGLFILPAALRPAAEAGEGVRRPGRNAMWMAGPTHRVRYTQESFNVLKPPL